MTEGRRQVRPCKPPSLCGSVRAQIQLSVPFYLGLGAPARRRTYPDCSVRAAPGREPELVRELLLLYRAAGPDGAGPVNRINFRCAAITLPESGEKIFFKEFPRLHRLHDVERALRCSRVDRAWRASHVLPRLGIPTPRAVGTALVRPEGETPVEYLATEWLDDTLPYNMRLSRASGDRAKRLALLTEFAEQLRLWHDRGIYLRDLVKNVLTRESQSGLEYWLSDLDQFHPVRRLTLGRLLHHMRQLLHWSGPLTTEEADAIVARYLGDPRGRTAAVIRDVLLSAAPPATG